jgi:hypothetical protein
MRTQIFRRLEIALTFSINGCAKPQVDFITVANASLSLDAQSWSPFLFSLCQYYLYTLLRVMHPETINKHQIRFKTRSVMFVFLRYVYLQIRLFSFEFFFLVHISLVSSKSEHAGGDTHRV